MNVLLLRDSSETDDKYMRYLTERDCTCFSFPVLSINFEKPLLGEFSVDANQEGIRRDGLFQVLSDNYSGLIFTSKNAVKFLQTFVESTSNTSINHDEIPCFVVGKATGNLLQSLNLNVSILGGTEAASKNDAESLSTQIAEYHRTNKCTKPWLFLCGDLRRDTIPSNLTANNVPFKEIVVYRSKVIDHGVILDSIDKVVQKIFWTDSSDFLTVVFFSPSGVDACLNGLLQMVSLERLKFACIGNTTANHLKSKLLDTCYNAEILVAKRPTPEGLYEAISSFPL